MIASQKLVVLFSAGGLSDVGRHAVQVALERSIEQITVLTTQPDSLQDKNWKCGCTEDHVITEEQQKRLTVVPVTDWKDESLKRHFEDATAVISCLGNRQPFIGEWCAYEGNQVVIQAKPKRVVILTSMGVEEDWPPVKSFLLGRIIMTVIFTVLGRKMFRDLTQMEKAYRATTDLSYLLVRPVGIGEEVVPCNEWEIRETGDNIPMAQINMAKLDVARYLVEEALNPTRSKEAVHICAVAKKEEEKE